MNFSYPWLLLLLIPIIIQLLAETLFYKKLNIFHQARTNIKKNNYKYFNFKNNDIKRYSFLIGTFCLALAVAGPQFGSKVKKVERQGVDLVIAFDTSISMDARDVRPSRIEKAKYEIGKLINNLKGDRVSIIVFAGTSHLYLPLTTDYEAAQLFLSAIDTKMIPNQGTSISSALEKAIDIVKKDRNKYKVVLLVSDGEDHEGNAIDLSKQASDLDITIHTIGIGSNMGGLIPINIESDQTKNFKRDKSGRLITSVLNKSMLEDIAKAGIGQFFHFSNSGQSYVDLSIAIDSMEKRKINSHEYSEYEERFQPIAFCSLIFFVISFLLPNRFNRDK